MTKQGIKSLGPNSFTITYSPGHTDKEFLDAFRLALTETENVEGQTRPKYGWEDYDHDFAYTPHEGSHELPWELDSGAFVARAINDDGLGYKYACIYIENNKLVLELRDDWDLENHTSLTYCKYRTRGLILHMWYEGTVEDKIKGINYYSEINHLDRQTLLVSASSRWLVFEIQPYSKYSSIGNTLLKSPIGIFECKYGHTKYKTKAFLTSFLSLSGKYSERLCKVEEKYVAIGGYSSWRMYVSHLANLYPLMLYPTVFNTLLDFRDFFNARVGGEFFGDHTFVGVATDFGTALGTHPNLYPHLSLYQETLNAVSSLPTTEPVILALKPVINAIEYTTHAIAETVQEVPRENVAPDGVLYGIKLSTFKGDNYTKFVVSCDEEYMLKDYGIKKDHIAWQARGEDMICSFLIPL